MKKTKTTRLHKASTAWNEMNHCDRCNWLKGIGHTGWANESWCNLPNFIRVAFIGHVEITRRLTSG